MFDQFPEDPWDERYIYLTWIVDFDGKCKYIYQSHGSYGVRSRVIITTLIRVKHASYINYLFYISSDKGEITSSYLFYL